MKKILFNILISISFAVITTAVWAWPTRPLTMVLTTSPGAASDQIARSVQSRLIEKFGVPIIIVYKPGADGKIATKFVAQSNDDHMMLLSSGQIGSLKDPIGDHTLDNLKAISILAVSPTIVTTSVDSKVKSGRQMLNMDMLTSGAAAGTISEILIQATNQTWTYAAYKGGVPMFTDLLAQHIDIGANSTMGSYNYINSNKLRPLMVFSKNRLTQLPDVPTSTELGIPINGEVWFGFLGPQSMSDNTVKKLSKEINNIAKESSFYDKLTSQGATVLGLNPTDSTLYIRQDLENLTRIYKDINK
jgi:tripartite-type tricarboxylate transporter receptor subunit TctC